MEQKDITSNADARNQNNSKESLSKFTTMLLISLVFTGVLSLFFMFQLNTGTTVMTENWLPSIILAEELNTATSDFRIAETSHVISQDNFAMSGYEFTINIIGLDIENMFQEYADEMITNETDQALLREARDLWSQYLEVHNKMIAYSKTNDTETAMDIMENESEDLFVEVSDVFSQLVAFNKEGAETASTLGDTIVYNSVIIFLMILVISVAVFVKFKHLVDEMEKTEDKLLESHHEALLASAKLKVAHEEALLNAEKLRYAHEEALLSSKAKSNFLANMSHEIRTPMNAISGMTDIILRETTNKDVAEYGMNIKRACDSLLSIINDVLDISKIESGKLEIIDSEYLLSNVLNDVLTIASNRLEHTELLFITNFQQDLPDKLLGDDVRVKQVMVNILNNAIKFTKEGHISFRVWGECLSEDTLKLSFSITDTGMGISEEDKDRLFENFERVNTTKNHKIEGTGLGLAITKRLCEMMDGEVIVESKLGKGTTFTLTVLQKYRDTAPLAQVEEEKSVLIFESRELYRNSLHQTCKELSLSNVVCCGLQSEFNEALQEQTFDFIFTSAMYHYKVQEMVLKMNLDAEIVLLADNADIKTKYDYTTILLPTHCVSVSNVLNGNTQMEGENEDYFHFKAPSCKVLVVDDNHVNLVVAQGLMKPYQFEIDTAENGEEAVKCIKNKQYDLVFMDHMMPVMDGIDATIAVRALQGDYYQNLPIVALTANAIVGTREIFLREGMNDFLPKPIKLNELNEILQKWLPKVAQIRVTQQLDEEQEEETLECEEETQRLVIDAVDTSLGIRRIGGSFSSYLKILEMYYKEGIKQSQKVSDFFDKKQFHDYKIVVHALKSSSATVGALDISEKAKLLEESCNKENWIYVNENHGEFIRDFNILLENIRESLKGQGYEQEENGKSLGDITLFQDYLKQLIDALDNMDIKLCDSLLEELSEYKWDEINGENLAKINEFVSDYEYDEAIEYINGILDL